MAILTRALTIAGGGALLVAALVDSIAALGRYAGMALHGSIEIVQAAVLVSGATALVAATLSGTHATVHLLASRLSPSLLAGLDRAADLLSALFFAAVLAGSIWLASDLWSASEQSDLLGIPSAPLRIIGCIALGAVVAIFAARAARGRP
jgi:TRAP-type transport system small permease protein